MADQTGTDRRREALRQVEACVCKDRQNSYGDAEDNFADIAAMWSIILRAKLKEPIVARDVAAACAAIKLCRIRTSPDYLDSWIDLAGYAVCGAGILAKEAESLAHVAAAEKNATGLAAIAGKWPGEETEEQVQRALDKLS